MEEIIGTIAATLTTVSFLPQVIKVIKTSQTKDISLSMYLIFTTGIAFWLVYGIILDSKPIIAANAITFVLTCIILYVKLKEKS